MRAVLALVALGALAGTANGATRAPVSLAGTLGFGAIPLSTCTRADAVDAKVVECSGRGPFAAGRLRGTGTIAWHWHLWQGGADPQTATGDEDAHVVLRLGARGTVRLTLRGKKGAGTSAGRWTYGSGTKQLARRRGSGTYTLTTVASSGNTFTNVKLVLRGSLR